MGLANQLGQFVPDLAHMTEPLRALMRKDVAYQWLEEHQHAFDKVKRLLTSDMTVSFFQPKTAYRPADRCIKIERSRLCLSSKAP